MPGPTKGRTWNCWMLGKSFNGTIQIPGKCQTWSCYDDTHNVVVSKCGDVPSYCRPIGLPEDSFPWCCRVLCLPANFMCQTPNNTMLKSGEVLHLTRPCVKYTCKRGVLVTQTCQAQLSHKCYATNVDKHAPYPKCCGFGRMCEI
uniref:8.9 kDa family member n=1 Tax=Rhipicephalus zambeziensis TaxID=60191 RepID=A0A224Y3Q4_9ACAR